MSAKFSKSRSESISPRNNLEEEKKTSENFSQKKEKNRIFLQLMFAKKFIAMYNFQKLVVEILCFYSIDR